MGVNFEKLQIFRLLCDLQSFSMVAKAIDASQSLISRNIQDLEKTIGHKLISNNQKPLVLTPYGKKLYELIILLNDDLNHIEENIVFQNNNFKNSQIRIFISISMVLGCILADKIKYLLSFFPEIYIDISFTNEITMDLLNKKDLVITREPYNHALVETKFLNTYKMMFGIGKQYLKKRGYPKFVSSLKYHDFIYIQDYQYDAFMSKEILDNISNKYTISNELAALQSISAGCGIGILPEFITKEFHEIYTFEIGEKLKPFEIHTSVSKVKSNSYIDLITDFLKNEL